ncbi:MAG: hypothetical protein L3J62_00690 [Gammaproteobacteria bacterium]|nr:hypothetical protein [Gammaproteobacteria bacterium]MCF6229299.1 hypothetical protein [Gammaproteobacteria bacterium]
MINSDPYGVVLWVVVGWPLLLAIPAVRRSLPTPDYLAILPALLLVWLPVDLSSTLSWLLLGVGVSVDGERRWVVAAVVFIWVLAATQRRDPQYTVAHWQNTLYLITLAGSLGVVLASDKVGFFSFSTLMGYGFYGLLVCGQSRAVQQAARYYLICLIIADLLLFEALLLSAFNHQQLSLSSLTDFSTPYLLMVFGAVILKAGLWPAHFWLCASYRSASPFSALLLVLPVVMALFTLIRWLPLGYLHDGRLGWLLMVAGGASILYAGWWFFQRSVQGMPLARASLLASGVVTAFVGLVLLEPLWWQPYGTLVYPLIALIGISLSVAGFICSRGAVVLPPYRSAPLVERVWVGCGALFRKLPAWYCHWHQAGLKRVKQLQDWLERQDSTRLRCHWRSAITLFVLLGVGLAWLVN